MTSHGTRYCLNHELEEVPFWRACRAFDQFRPSRLPSFRLHAKNRFDLNLARFVPSLLDPNIITCSLGTQDQYIIIVLFSWTNGVLLQIDSGRSTRLSLHGKGKGRK